MCAKIFKIRLNLLKLFTEDCRSVYPNTVHACRGCTEVCALYGIRLGRPCKRDGYQDPKNCWRCRCPDGFGGNYCETVATGLNGWPL